MPKTRLEAIPWHTAFVDAIKLEFYLYADFLEFQSELPLNAEPLRVDMVIKKPPDLIIENPLGRIFRPWNILEYKSPEDYLAVSDFHKILAYAHLFISLNGINMSDLTITFVVSRHPRVVFNYIKTAFGCSITEAAPGIHQVSSKYIPIQIVETKRLSASDNLWLSGLTKDLNYPTADAILTNGEYRNLIKRASAYFSVLFNVNAEILQEAAMKEKRKTLTEVLEELGFIAEWKAEGKLEGEAEGWGKALDLMEKGYTVEQLKAMSPEKV
jgi:hypothetical protein